MRLVELIRDANAWEDDLIIYVEAPWSPDADAVFVVAEGNSAQPVTFHAKQYNYFLETFIARDFIEDYARSAEGGLRPACQALDEPY